MKKLLTLSASKIYLVCGLSFFLTLGSFWHHQMNQTQLDFMNVLNQGVGTCFNRISQTFTAMMIKDIQSPYLNRGFMTLSNECLNETIKGINPFKKNVGKGYQTLNQLLSDVHWFHEKVSKIHSAILANPKLKESLLPLSERFEQMEAYKLDLVDEIDAASTQFRKLQANDEYLMASGLILFILALALLSVQDFNRQQVRREIEQEALNLLTAGKANLSYLLDQHLDKALSSQNMPISAQIFRDYHEAILEKIATTGKGKVEKKEPEVSGQLEEVLAITHRTSLKEVLISIENTHVKDTIHMSEVRDVLLNVSYEIFEQVLSAAVYQLATRKLDNKKIMIGNQVHSDKSIVNLFLGGSTFTASELEYAEGESGTVLDGIDLNLIVLKEMVQEAGIKWHLENKLDRSGKISGMNIRFIVNRVPKSKGKLVSLTKGRKKDLAREMYN